MKQRKMIICAAAIAAIVLIGCLLLCSAKRQASESRSLGVLTPRKNTSAESAEFEPSDEISDEAEPVQADFLPSGEETQPPDSEEIPPEPAPNQIGTSLNTASFDERQTCAEGFYHEPLSQELVAYMIGRSLPSDYEETADTLAVSVDDLVFLHVMHYDTTGEIQDGELIVNRALASDLCEIFSALYEKEYPIESIILIDVFGGDDLLSMEANNTSCFNYRTVEGSTSLSQHAYGRAVDINPLYNPYITYNTDGSERISPSEAVIYSDRTADFPYKITVSDLCYKLFRSKGFTWGGSWKTLKDYQHFQKK